MNYKITLPSQEFEIEAESPIDALNQLREQAEELFYWGELPIEEIK